ASRPTGRAGSPLGAAIFEACRPAPAPCPAPRMDHPEDLTIEECQPIEAAFHRLNANKLGIVFAVNGSGEVTGTVTDGDIRRPLLVTRDLKQPISACVNRQFVSARLDTRREQILKLLDHRIHVVPVLDATGRLVDTYSRE